MIVATVDDLDEALDVLDRETVDLIVSDVRLRTQKSGIELAITAKRRAFRHCSQPGTPIRAQRANRGRLPAQAIYRAPIVQGDLSVDRHLQGEKVKKTKGLELFTLVDEAE